MKFCFIVNPNSGVKKSLNIFEQVENVFRSKNITPDLFITEHRGHAIDIIKNIDIDSYKGIIIIEVQYLMNTLKDLTFDNIYHEHYNYWSLTSLVNFFNQFNVKIFTAEMIDTH